MSMMEIFEKGGPVVLVLAAYSLVALAIVVERYLHLMLMKPVPREVEEHIQSGAGEYLEEKINGMKGPEANIVKSMLKASRQGVKDLSRVASRVGSEEMARMERGLPTLAFLGNTAPLLGLFGTITGMIKAFMVIESAGGKVDAQALAGGIWEAMVTTGVGLAVSIPVLLFLHLLEGITDRKAHSMKRLASMLLERLPHSGETVTEDTVRHRKGVLDGV